MKSHGAGTAVEIAGGTEGKHDQDDSAEEREEGEEEEGAFGDGHQSAAGRSAPGEAPTHGLQGGAGNEQKDARDGVMRVHQQENARLGGGYGR